MENPYLKYYYRKTLRFDYDKWVEQCADELEEPLMREQDANRLEHLYDKGVSYTPEQHRANIRFLEELLATITYVWPWNVRQKANMASLVEDYKHYFNIEENI